MRFTSLIISNNLIHSSVLREFKNSNIHILTFRDSFVLQMPAQIKKWITVGGSLSLVLNYHAECTLSIPLFLIRLIPNETRIPSPFAFPGCP
jgi:hypothetical protein